MFAERFAERFNEQHFTSRKGLMIDVSRVTAGTFALLSSHSLLVSAGFTVEEGEPLNQNLHQTPWVGVYYGTLNLEPHTLGAGRPWRAELELLLYVQERSHRSGQEATRLLGRAQARVLEALRADTTLGGTATALVELAVNPYQRDLEEDTWLFTNEIVLKAELRG